MKYKVGAYKDGEFSHWASGCYEVFAAAQDYCDGCKEKCAGITGMTYKVVEVAV